MKTLLILLLLTACGQTKQEAAPVAEMAEETITEEPDLRSAQEKYDTKDTSIESMETHDWPIVPFDPEYAKEKDEREIWQKELEAMRKPISDTVIVKRLIKTQDGYNRLRFIYFASNTAIQDLTWYHEIYLDPETHVYYHARFMPTNLDGFEAVINTKRDPNREKHSQLRVVFLTNLSPSVWVYADALNDYKLYVAEYKNIVDTYFVFYNPYKRRKMYVPIDEFYKDIPKNNFTFAVSTNRTMNRPIMYHAETNGIPVGERETNYYWSIKMGEDLTNFVRNSITDKVDNTYNGGIVKYTPETKAIYYGVKYNYFGDIADLTNTDEDFYIGHDEYGGVYSWPIQSLKGRESNFPFSLSTDFAREEETGTLTP